MLDETDASLFFKLCICDFLIDDSSTTSTSRLCSSLLSLLLLVVPSLISSSSDDDDPDVESKTMPEYVLRCFAGIILYNVLKDDDAIEEEDCIFI